jgi:hypothetical protein
MGIALCYYAGFKDKLILLVIMWKIQLRDDQYQGTVWMVGVNIYPKENDLPLLIFALWGVWMEW